MEVLEDLWHKFSIDPYRTTIHSVELSVLLSKSKYLLSEYIENLMVHHARGSKPKRFNFVDFKKPSLYKICKRSHYNIKMYLRNLKYSIDKPYLAFEVVYLKMERLNKLGFKTLKDTVNKPILLRLKEEIVKRIDETLIYDWTIDEEKLDTSDRVLIKDYRNQKQWVDWDKDRRHYYLSKYRLLIEKYSYKVKNHFKEMVIIQTDKWTESNLFDNSDNLTLSLADDSDNLTTKELKVIHSFIDSPDAVDSANLTNKIVSSCDVDPKKGKIEREMSLVHYYKQSIIIKLKNVFCWIGRKLNLVVGIK